MSGVPSTLSLAKGTECGTTGLAEGRWLPDACFVGSRHVQWTFACSVKVFGATTKAAVERQEEEAEQGGHRDQVLQMEGNKGRKGGWLWGLSRWLEEEGAEPSPSLAQSRCSAAQGQYGQARLALWCLSLEPFSMWLMGALQRPLGPMNVLQDQRGW